MTLPTEFANSRYPSRKKLLLSLLGTLLVILGYLVIRYILSPEEVQKSLRYSKTGLSWDNLLIFSSIAIFIFVFKILWLRIVLRIVISPADDRLEITQIQRFRWKPKIVEAKLSQTQIQVEETEEAHYMFGGRQEASIHIYLINPTFGDILVSGQDFENIREIVSNFEQIKEDTAAKIRKRRRRS